MDSRSDEDDVRVRATRHGSRPRTRTRPAHDEAVPGLVIAVDRGRMTVRVEGPEGAPVEVTAMRARELGKHGVVVGDRVRVVGDTSGRTDSLARIVTI
ncbi:MAG: rsgA, partial [Modestobacter sp.]|nr:rsgA [Modestobacter sp.]